MGDLHRGALADLHGSLGHQRALDDLQSLASDQRDPACHVDHACELGGTAPRAHVRLEPAELGRGVEAVAFPVQIPVAVVLPCRFVQPRVAGVRGGQGLEKGSIDLRHLGQRPDPLDDVFDGKAHDPQLLDTDALMLLADHQLCAPGQHEPYRSQTLCRHRAAIRGRVDRAGGDLDGPGRAIEHHVGRGQQDPLARSDVHPRAIPAPRRVWEDEGGRRGPFEADDAHPVQRRLQRRRGQEYPRPHAPDRSCDLAHAGDQDGTAGLIRESQGEAPFERAGRRQLGVAGGAPGMPRAASIWSHRFEDGQRLVHARFCQRERDGRAVSQPGAGLLLVHEPDEHKR